MTRIYLLDSTVNKPLSTGPTPQYKKQIDAILREAYEENDPPRVPVMYFVPKSHKNMERPPGPEEVPTPTPWPPILDNYQRVYKTPENS